MPSLALPPASILPACHMSLSLAGGLLCRNGEMLKLNAIRMYSLVFKGLFPASFHMFLGHGNAARRQLVEQLSPKRLKPIRVSKREWVWEWLGVQVRERERARGVRQSPIARRSRKEPKSPASSMNLCKTPDEYVYKH